MHLGHYASECICPDSSSAQMGGWLKSPLTSFLLVRKTFESFRKLEITLQAHMWAFKIYLGNANSERTENSNDFL